MDWLIIGGAARSGTSAFLKALNNNEKIFLIPEYYWSSQLKSLDKSVFQKYDASNRDSRLPDFRQQLYWESDLKMDQTNNEISFFTSDVTGTFEVKLEGITSDGTPISISKRFSVY